MSQENPYTPPAEAGNKALRLASPFRKVMWWSVYLYPVFTLTMIYFCWALTVASLGRRPGFGEHPNTEPAHFLYHLLSIIAGIALLASPLVILAGLSLSIALPFAKSSSEGPLLRQRIVCVLGVVTMIGVAAGLLMYDPFGIMYWFFD